VKYGAWILCAAGEISGRLILVSKILTGKYVLSLLKETNQEKSSMAI
jgi:hypothetical protein